MSDTPPRSAATAAQALWAVIDRVCGPGRQGPGEGSWLAQVQDGTLNLSPAGDADLAVLLDVVRERLRQTREVAGGDLGADAYPYAGAGAQDLFKSRLPLNRKERYYTGTVLPMLVASDGFAHLHRFLRLCGLSGEVVSQGTWGLNGDQPVQFFTEYSLLESIVGEDLQNRFADRPAQADTPDVVVVGRDWLLAVEAKVYHRPTRQALEAQMHRQHELVTYLTEKFDMDPERVRHVLLLPEKLQRARPGLSVDVVTWEQVLEEYRVVAPPYWSAVLRQALEDYDALASREQDYGTNADKMMSGEDIWNNAQGDLVEAWVGRSLGLDGATLAGDISSGTWRTRKYEVSFTKVLNRNWFPAAAFVALIATAATEGGDPPRP